MFELFDLYRKQNTENHGNSYCDVDHLLRFWRENKSKYLRPLFGDQLILEKEVKYQRSNGDMEKDMWKMLHEYHSFFHRVRQSLYDYTESNMSHGNDFERVIEAIMDSLSSPASMVTNELYLGYSYNKGNYEDNKSYTFIFNDGSKVQLQRGMKITRAFTQLCKHIDMADEWEKFRIRHSQVLNQKMLTGTLCLSIHPLDYATASDNDNGWSSCMSWREEGCYRMGTVEMMNSPMVICAYLKSHNQFMSIKDDNDWNSKKWRAWIIVTKDVIVCNRHYPYHQEHFATKAIEWVRDLVNEHYGWEYEDIHEDFYLHMSTTDRNIDFTTDYMYNDLGGDDVIGCFRKDATMRTLPGVIHFSGPAECMVCGEEIKPDAQNADTLCCRECDGYITCSCCGRDINDDEIFYGPDDEPYCDDCYNEKFVECGNCGCIEERENTQSIVMPFSSDVIDAWRNKYGDDREGISEKYIYTDHPAARLWYLCIRYSPSTSEPNVVCNDCASKWHLKTIKYDGIHYTIPDPNVYDYKQACEIANVFSWHWVNMIHEVSWAEKSEIDGANMTEDFYKMNWEWVCANFRTGEETAA